MLMGKTLGAFGAQQRLAENKSFRREGADYRNRRRPVNAESLKFSVNFKVFSYFTLITN
jgi:hypothetical protein